MKNYFKLKYIKILYNKIKNKTILNYLKKQYTQPTLKQTKINNYKIAVFLNDGIGRQIYGLKKYEKEHTNFLKTIINKDWVCLDIGANIGYYTLLLSKLARNGKIYSFEPNSTNFQLLNLNVYINDFQNVITNQIALSNENNYQNFKITKDSAFASFKNTERSEVIDEVKVKTKKLDDYIQEKEIKKIDFIKIDVEGAEKLVLDGAQNILQALKPKIILTELCEDNLRPFNENGVSITNFLKNFNYSPFSLSNSKLKPNIQNKHQDMYFVHQSYQGQIKI